MVSKVQDFRNFVVSLPASPGVGSTILARSNTFKEIDHEIISTIILLLSLI